jgi:putative heme-binding domain-containing protein
MNSVSVFNDVRSLSKTWARSKVRAPVFTLLLAFIASTGRSHGQDLQERLQREAPSQLASDAKQQGDAQRGAIVFFQQQMACAKCHTMGGDPATLSAPDLSSLKNSPTQTSDTDLVESILQPSKSIRKGFESMAVITDDGEVHLGLFVERSDKRIVLRDAQNGGDLKTLDAADVDEARMLDVSIMPVGQVNQLNSRQQFLDLIRYLMEIRDGGIRRAQELQPTAAMLTFKVPEYEQHLDHAGLIADWNDEALGRGEAVYQRVCANCHGTREQLGSLPTSLRFAEGRFKNGSDPLSMYRTMTHGFGLMTPQSWMVPSQKYDVIHYIREEYLRKHNPSQLTEVTEAYLAKLPLGDTRGPEPSSIVPWSAMDYGPSLTHTYEVPGPKHNFAYKGVAIRLDAGAGGVSRGRHWMLFDTDTLRIAAAWNGSGSNEENFIDWQGIQFNGAHGVHPHIVGDIAIANATGPGWANPSTGEFSDDLRVLGRDGKRYGPLPREWAKFRGQYHYGQDVVLAYSVGSTEVLESPRLLIDEEANSAPIFLRTFNIGPRTQELVLQVAEHAAADAQLSTDESADNSIAWLESANAKSQALPFAFDGSSYLEVAQGHSLDLTQDFTISARIRTRTDGTILALAQTGPKWVPDGQTFFVRDGRLCFDIGWIGAVAAKSRVDNGQWHNVAVTWTRATQQLRLYVDGRVDGQGKIAARAKLPDSVARIGFTAPNFPAKSFFEGDIAEVRFYQEVLKERIGELANSDRRQNSLLARWEISSGDGVRVDDLSSHQNDAEVRRGATTQSARTILAGLSPLATPVQWLSRDGRLLLKIPAGKEPLRFTISLPSNQTSIKPDELPQHISRLANMQIPDAARDLLLLTVGGPPRWNQRIETQVQVGNENGPFAVDTLVAPESNPWLAQTRFTGLDFFADGRLAVCDWDGDVWIVAEKESTLSWQRIASGMFQPLGLKIVDGKIHVTCRDQLTVLHDFNGDDEIDFYECLNNDHQVTEHFHEFAMGLQVDGDGNFYYAKSGEHGKPAVVPHHGTLLQVSRDGLRTRILANGFRAANGVCLNPDGSFVVTDQEGFWNPKNRINWVTLDDSGKPKFYGNMLGYHDVTDESDSAMEPPLCWITNKFDRSPGELLWVDSERWGPLNGSLLNLSYGYGKVFLVPHEKVDGKIQGGMIELPIPAFPTGVMRGRFNPRDQQLYACGMFAWAGNATQPGGLYRLRTTGNPMHLPIELHAARQGLQLVFTAPLQRESIQPENIHIKTWALKRSAKYGSDHYDERELAVSSTRLSADGMTLEVSLPKTEPTWCMSIEYDFQSSDGAPIRGLIHNTIHNLAD